MHFLAKGSRETLRMILCQNSIDNNYSCISQEECREDSQLEPAAGCQCNATLSNPFLERCIHFYCPTTPTEGRERQKCGGKLLLLVGLVAKLSLDSPLPSPPPCNNVLEQNK